MATVREALASASARLAAAGVPDPARDARVLMAGLLGMAPGRLSLVSGDILPEAAAARWPGMLAAREARQPVAQILGRRLFWGRDFRVTGDVLDPRPETETLIALALQEPARRVLDIGTGTGCILLTLLAEWPAATGLGTDRSPEALAVATGNAADLGLGGRAAFLATDWAADAGGPFDLVVSNPPYIAQAELAGLDPDVTSWEPAMALSPGPEGVESYRALIPQAWARLASGRRLLLEIGATQGGCVAELCQAAGFAAVAVHPDLDGRDRVVSARKPDSAA